MQNLNSYRTNLSTFTPWLHFILHYVLCFTALTFLLSLIILLFVLLFPELRTTTIELIPWLVLSLTGFGLSYVLRRKGLFLSSDFIASAKYCRKEIKKIKRTVFAKDGNVLIKIDFDRPFFDYFPYAICKKIVKQGNKCSVVTDATYHPSCMQNMGVIEFVLPVHGDRVQDVKHYLAQVTQETIRVDNSVHDDPLANALMKCNSFQTKTSAEAVILDGGDYIVILIQAGSWLGKQFLNRLVVGLNLAQCIAEYVNRTRGGLKKLTLNEMITESKELESVIGVMRR